MTLAVAERIDLTPRAKAMALAKTRAGRLIFVALFTALMGGLQMDWWWVIGICLAATSAFPQHRRAILIPAAVLFAFLMPPLDLTVLKQVGAPRGVSEAMLNLWPIAVPIAWGIAFAFLWVVQRYPRSIVAQRPVTGLIAVLLLLMAIAATPLRGAAWVIAASMTMVFAQYIWFFAYWVTENHQREKGHPVRRTGFWRPFWGFTFVPYGKGATYLERVEAKNDDELAIAQFKGIKLIFWAIVLTAMIVLVNKFIYRVPGDMSLTKLPDVARPLSNPIIPTYPMALEAMQAGSPYAISMRWAALLLYFVMRVAGLTVWGAKVIAIARMAGFNAFRNTYRPFESPTIAEFYNRIYYYFKELLVAFFFYPTYLRYLKKWPRVRLFTATVAAAGLGNWLFHFLRDQELVFRHGFWRALWLYHSYAVYALILGTAIGVSQLRSQAKKGKFPVGAARIRAFMVIMLFYILISSFEEPNTRHGVADYAKYCCGLFVP